MVSWDYFNKDIHYKYVGFLIKGLSPVESAYLEFLRSSVDEQVHNTLKWYDEYQEDLKKLHDMGEFEDYYNDSRLEMVLITFLGGLLDKNTEFIKNFYISGSNLADSHMGKNTHLLSSDEEALSILTNYSNGVVESINQEFAYGMKQCIGRHIENKTLTDFKKDLIGLPYTPITTPFSVDNRCVFTTKTEYARGVNTGVLQGYSNYGVDVYDWVTSGLPNVCDTCKDYEANSPYTLNEIINMCPCHVNCVCSMKAKLPKELYLQETPVIVDLTPKKRR